MNNFHAFTLKSDTRLREIVTDLGVSLPFVGDVLPTGAINNIHQTKALWDTGATNSVITVGTAASLGLKPISKAQVFHAGGESTVNVYLINVYLPNNLVIPNVRVSECADNAGNFGVIIGMDIITSGDFAITNVGGKTTFTFRLPSIDTVDYVKDANEITAKSYSKAQRNDPCPCGSGKKFKQCHGK